jgi:hypothetical protein
VVAYVARGTGLRLQIATFKLQRPDSEEASGESIGIAPNLLIEPLRGDAGAASNRAVAFTPSQGPR